MDESENEGDGGEAEPGEEDSKIRVCSDGDWVGGVLVITVNYPYEADAIEGAVDIVL